MEIKYEPNSEQVTVNRHERTNQLLEFFNLIQLNVLFALSHVHTENGQSSGKSVHNSVFSCSNIMWQVSLCLAQY